MTHLEKSADGRKSQKKRVTINACSNVTGTIKLPLLFIGKSKNPRCFKNINCDNLPVVYTNQSNAWVNATIFADWFHNKFVPFVHEKLTEMNHEPKAVLLIDNCSAQPNEEQLISSDGKIIAKFLPFNVTSLIQPMDQDVLVSIKRRYKKKILEELVLHDTNGTSIISYLKQIDILKVIELVAASWDEIQPSTLRLSWRKIFKEETDENSPPTPNEEAENNTCTPCAHVTDDLEPSTEDFHSIFGMLGNDLPEGEILEWLEADQNDRGYTHMTDQEIIAEVTQEEEQDQENEGDEDKEDEVSQTVPSISNGEAMRMFDDCLQWLQQQDEANVYSMRVLRELRELAAKKRMNSLKQRSLREYLGIPSSNA